MIVRVLGSAAGGGVPQWNCACTNCTAARAGMIPRRLQSSLAISHDGKHWILLNVSPDITHQIENYEPLQPRSLRSTPIVAMLLTDANIDHAGGLTALRQCTRGGLTLWSTAQVRDILSAQAGFERFVRKPHQWLPVSDKIPWDPLAENADLCGKLTVQTVAVRGQVPGYAGRREEKGAVVGYILENCTTRRRLLFAPVFLSIDAALNSAIEEVDIAFLDGSFFDDREMIAEHLSDKLATSLGHQPLSGPNGTLRQIAKMNARCILTHINNSNPILDPKSSAAAEVARSGAEIAYDGLELEL